MCLIIRKPAERRICADFLRHAWQLNADGWGAFHLAGDRVVSARGMHLEQLLDYNAQLPLDAEVFIHLRKATYGEVNEAMAHPYRVRDRLLLMHNGSIHRLAPDDRSRSDTSELARLLADMLAGLDDEQVAALIRSDGFSTMTAPLVEGSMVILFDQRGAVRLGRDWHTVAAGEWDGVMPGIEVSNTHAWQPKSRRRAPAWRQWIAAFAALRRGRIHSPAS